MIFTEHIALENVIVGGNIGGCELRPNLFGIARFEGLFFCLISCDIHGHEMAAFICLD